MKEEMICNALDWDVNIITPMNYVEAVLLFVDDYSTRDHVRRLSHEMVVFCLTGKRMFDDEMVNVQDCCLDDRCMDICVASMGMSCVLLACEMAGYGETIRKQVYESVDSGEDAVCEVCKKRMSICCNVMIGFRLH